MLMLRGNNDQTRLHNLHLDDSQNGGSSFLAYYLDK